MMQFISRQSREHARRLGRAVPSRTRQALSQSTPRTVRQLSTAGSTTTASSFTLPSTLAIALGTAVVGIGSYYSGSRNDGAASTKAASAATSASEAAAAAGAAARAAEAAAAVAAAAAPTPVYGTPEDFKRAIKELQDSFEENMVSTEHSNLFTHGFSPNVMHEGEWYPHLTHFRALTRTGAPKNTGVAHSVVVYPFSTEDVVRIVRIANKYRMPIVPYAGGTSLEGHFIGVSNLPSLTARVT